MTYYKLISTHDNLKKTVTSELKVRDLDYTPSPEMEYIKDGYIVTEYHKSVIEMVRAMVERKRSVKVDRKRKKAKNSKTITDKELDRIALLTGTDKIGMYTEKTVKYLQKKYNCMIVHLGDGVHDLIELE